MRSRRWRVRRASRRRASGRRRAYGKRTAQLAALTLRRCGGLAAQRWGIGGPVLVFFALFGALDGLFRWNNPVKTVLLFHFGEDERLIFRNERKHRAQEIGSVRGRG